MKTIAIATIVENFDSESIDDWVIHEVPVESWYVTKMDKEPDDVIPGNPEGVHITFDIGTTNHSIVITEDALNEMIIMLREGRKRHFADG